LDYNIVYVALPDVGSDLGFSANSLQWVVSGYAIAFGGALLLGGRAADLLGRRRMFITALLIYAVASATGGLAGSPAVLVGARVAQGLGGALLFPATLSLVTTLFAEGRPERNRALAIWGGAGASGLSLGALLGGVLTEAFGWSATFFVNVPLAGLVALAALTTIAPDAARTTRRGFDLPGATAATAGVVLAVLALVQGPVSGWTSTVVVLSAIGAVALLAAFAAIEARAADPLMPLRMLENASLRASMSITFIFMAGLGTLPYILTIAFQDVHGYSALESGVAFLGPSLSIAVGTQIGERLVTGAGVRPSLIGGLLLGAVGLAGVALALTPDGTYLALLPGIVVMGVGQGITWTAMWIASASGVRQHEQGVASGMASTTQQVGAAMGLAVAIAVIDAALDDRGGQALRSATADGLRTATFVTAGLTLVGALVAARLRVPAPAAEGATATAPEAVIAA
jgi:EmrB/QacA subfamily drug resistance transporter